MKTPTIYLVFALLLFMCSCGIIVINPKYSDLTENEKEKVAPKLNKDIAAFYSDYNNLNSYQIFSTNSEHTKSIIKGSKKEYVLLVFYANWCFPCKKQMPIINEFERKNSKRLNVLYISTSEWSQLDKDRNYLKSLKLASGASLVVDNNIYGDKYSPKKRFTRFFEELNFSKYDSKAIGFPTFILVKNDLTHLYTNSGVFETEKLQTLISRSL